MMGDRSSGDDGDIGRMSRMPMRTGRSVYRTLYLHDPAESDPKKDTLVGLVDTKELAAEITRRWNTVLPRSPEDADDDG